MARDSWDNVVAALKQGLPVEQVDLRYGYRVPRQVMALANKVLPFAAPDVVPAEVFRDGDDEPRLVEESDPEDHVRAAIEAARDYMGRGLLVGVIVPSAALPRLTSDLDSQQVRWRDGSEGFAWGALNVVTPMQAKGLEFDAVVVVSPHLIVDEAAGGHRLLYVALTRTTNALTVIHSGDPLALDSLTHVEGPAEPTHTPDRPVDNDEPDVLPPTGQTPDTPVTADVDLIGDSDRPRRMGQAVATTVAQLCADEVRDTVPERLWPDVIDQRRRELGVSSDDLLERLD